MRALLYRAINFELAQLCTPICKKKIPGGNKPCQFPMFVDASGSKVHQERLIESQISAGLLKLLFRLQLVMEEGL